MTVSDVHADAPPQPARGRALRLILGVAALLLIVAYANTVQDIVAPFFLSLNLVIVVWPIQRLLCRWMPRAIASIIAGIVAIGILLLFFWSLGWTISMLINVLPSYQSQFQSFLDQLIALANSYGITATQIFDQLRTINPSTVVNAMGSVVSNVGGALSLLSVVVILLFFMILDSIDFADRLERIGERHNPVLAVALQSFAQGTRKYWVVATVFGLIVAAFNWGLLTILGIPLAMAWAILSFVTNYIPNIGFVIGLIPPALMALLTGDPLAALWVVIGYSVVNFTIQSLVQPKVAGDAVGITPTVSFLSLLVWTLILGPLGTILAIPATLLVKAIVIDSDPQARWLNALIAADPTTSEEKPVITMDRVRQFIASRRAKEADAQKSTLESVAKRAVLVDADGPSYEVRTDTSADRDGDDLAEAHLVTDSATVVVEPEDDAGHSVDADVFSRNEDASVEVAPVRDPWSTRSAEEDTPAPQPSGEHAGGSASGARGAEGEDTGAGDASTEHAGAGGAGAEGSEAGDSADEGSTD